MLHELSTVTEDGVERALKGMKRVKSAQDGRITAGLLKDEGDIVQGKLAKLFSEFPTNLGKTST